VIHRHPIVYWWLIGLAALTLLLCAAQPAHGQPAQRDQTDQAAFDMTNVGSIIKEAGRVLPGSKEDDTTGNFHATISIVLLLTVLSLAPSILVMCTSFTRIIVVLALLRQALGTQSLPPSQVLVGLALFMTLLVMAPTFQQINQDAIVPLTENQINELQAWDLAKAPIKAFMFDQIQYAGNEADVFMILEYRGIDTSRPELLTLEKDVDIITLVPSFILSELKVAFLMGFQLYLPFLIIDMVISSILISMGMMMLPPVLISLPFKLLLFVLVDGWMLVAGNLLSSFAVPGVTT
jgi:flagellar biosynthesis protein FliP